MSQGVCARRRVVHVLVSTRANVHVHVAGSTEAEVAATQRAGQCAGSWQRARSVALTLNNQAGYTALMYAAAYGRLAFCKALVEAKADAALASKVRADS
jgi:hypothetical protein